MRNTLVSIFILASSVVFAQDDKRVFNLENPKDTAYLFKTGILYDYPNCRLEEEDSAQFEKYVNALQYINSELVVFIQKNKFNFGTEEKSIQIMHKYYVNAIGEIEYCSFMAHSELSKRTVKRYTKLLKEFIADRNVSYESETPFFICGQSRFWLKSRDQL